MIADLPSSPSSRLSQALQRGRQSRPCESRGRVVQLVGLVIESEGPMAAVGEVCRIESNRHDRTTLAEVVGFRDHHLLLMPLDEIHPPQEFFQDRLATLHTQSCHCHDA